MRRRTPSLIGALGIGLLVLLAGCTGFGPSGGEWAGGIAAPSGFEETSTPPIPEDGVSVSAYVGSGSRDEALASFEQSARDAGWEPLDGRVEFSAAGTQYSGTAFEKGDEMLVLQVSETNGDIMVMVLKGPKEMAGTSTPSEDGDTSGDGGDAETPPASDVQGEDIPDVPRYPDSVRTEYGSVTDQSGVVIVVAYHSEADPEEVASFYEEGLAENGWTDISKFQRGGEFAVTASREGESVTVAITDSTDYEGYTEIGIEYTGQGD